ncbi:MAG: hypothetical protein JWM91_4302 [Rhodospirillales bacterium]|nr:hypothetical protein [Rhodospirillales bacterium]
MGEGFSIAQQWEIHFLVAALAAWPLIRIFRRAGLSPWPVVLVLIPIFGIAIVGSMLAFKRWPLVAPRVAPKPVRKTRAVRAR